MIKRISMASIVTSLLTAMAVSSYAETIELGTLGCEAPKLTGLEWVKGDAIEMKHLIIFITAGTHCDKQVPVFIIRDKSTARRFIKKRDLFPPSSGCVDPMQLRRIAKASLNENPISIR